MFRLYRHYCEDNTAIFSFLLLALTSQLIADSNAAYPTDSRWHSSISDIARCWIMAGLASLQSGLAIPCNTCKCWRNTSAIPVANAAGAGVHKRGYKNEVKFFLHCSPDNDMNQPSPNLMAKKPKVKLNLLLK